MKTKLIRKRCFIQCVSLAALAAATVSCGNVVRSSRSPVMLAVNSLQAAKGNSATTLSGTLFSDVITNVSTPPPCSTSNLCPTVFNDVGSAVLAVVMKDVSVSPTTNNQVTITGYHVTYRRADGHNVEGVDVPFAFDGAATVTIQAGATGTIGFELVRHAAKEESPLVQLKVNPNIITTIGDVTFYGHDLVGNDLSVTGSILIDFGNFGD